MDRKGNDRWEVEEALSYKSKYNKVLKWRYNVHRMVSFTSGKGGECIERERTDGKWRRQSVTKGSTTRC